MNSQLRYIKVLCALTLTLLWCVPTLGQVLKGSISGIVVDPQGAVVSQAQVTAKNVETGVMSTTTTDNSGDFRFNLLPVGTYNVETTSHGFKTTSQKGVVVNAGADTGVGTLHLSVGETSTTVEVSAEAPLIEPTQSQVTNTFAGVTLRTFSGIQENQGLDNLAQFVPGINASRSNNFSNQNGPGFTVDGLRGRNNDQEIDGQNNNDNSVGGPGLFLSNPEFVQQYVIVTNQFGPEYGRNAGSMVNIITKSGTNAYHGSIFGTENNSYLNAMTATQKNFATKVDGVSPLTGPPRLNDEFTGFTLGGPVLKNKLFMSGGWDNEIIGQSTVFQSSALTPTPAGLSQLAGCFPTGFGAQQVALISKFGPYGITAGNPVPFEKTGAPSPTTVAGCGSVPMAGVTRILSSPVHEYDWYTKTDLQLGKDTITGRYLYNKNTTANRADSGNASAAAGYTDDVPALSQIALISWTHSLTARMVNEARLSFGRLNVEFGGNAQNTVPVAGQLGTAFPNITFNSPGFMAFGPATNIPQSRIVNTWQGQDNWNYVLGKHSLKAGVNWTYQRSPNIFLPNFNGQFRFTDWSSFFTDMPNRTTVAAGPSSLDFREYDTFAYVGDDWKIGQSLTLNLGLTWSYYGQPANLMHDITAPRESNPGTAFWSSVEPSTSGFLNPGAALPLSDRTYPSIPAPTDSFGPSVGFAYSPEWGGFLTGRGKTVFRGGYRIAYDPPYYNIYLNMATAAPQVFLQTFSAPQGSAGLAANQFGVPATPTGTAVRAQLQPQLALGVFDPRTFAQTSIPTDFKPDRVQSWTLGFEREVSKAAAVEIRYVGNKGEQLFQSVDANPFIGALASAYPNLIPSGITPCPASQAFFTPAGTPALSAASTSNNGGFGRVNCNEGVVRSRNNTGYSNYNGIQTEFRADNLFKQLTMRAGYTFSKTTDNVSEIFNTGTAGTTLAYAQNPLNITTGEHGISGINFPNRFTLQLTEELPFYKAQHGLAGHMIGGWAVSVGYIYATGQPYTPEQINEATNTAGDFYDNLFNGNFIGVETARPFAGNPSAPIDSVGIFAADACTLFVKSTFRGPGPNQSPFCTAAPTQLISINAMNIGLDGGKTLEGGCPGPGCLTATTLQPTAVTNQAVRFIINSKIAQQIFGTPFGNVGRNGLTDAPANVLNSSIFKRIRISERMSAEIHLTAINTLNHFNFSSVDPVLQDAGHTGNGFGFANPRLTTTNAITDGFRKVYLGAKFSF